MESDIWTDQGMHSLPNQEESMFNPSETPSPDTGTQLYSPEEWKRLITAIDAIGGDRISTRTNWAEGVAAITTWLWWAPKDTSDCDPLSRCQPVRVDMSTRSCVRTVYRKARLVKNGWGRWGETQWYDSRSLQVMYSFCCLREWLCHGWDVNPHKGSIWQRV